MTRRDDPPAAPGSRPTRSAADTVRRLLRRHRRSAAAALAAIAVLAALAALQPDREPTRRVVVAAVDLPSGATLAPGDLTVSEVPASAVAPGTLADPAAAAGRIAIAPLAAGEPVTETRLLDPRPDAGEGRVAVPVRLADAGVIALLSPGEVIDLVAVAATSPDQGTDAGEIVARGARVLVIPRMRSTTGPPGGFEDGALVLVSVPVDSAARLAALSGQRRLSPILRSS